MNNSEKHLKIRKTCIQLLCTITFFLLLSFCYLNTSAQTHFSDVTTGPVLSYGQPGDWDDAVVWNPAIVKDGDTLRMWYTGHNESIWTKSTVGNIGYAWSVDWHNWNKSSSNPVVQAEHDWEGDKLYGCAVIKDGDTLKMWYGADWTSSTTSYNVSPAKKIGYAKSLDGKTWIKHSDPVLETGSESDWDSDYIVPQTVIKQGSEYKMWFYGGKPGFPTKVVTLPQIGLATSLDGIHWTKHNNPATTEALYANSDPVLKVGSNTDWDAHRVINPIVLSTDSGGYEMWYTGLKGPITSSTKQKVGYATSDDGITWAKWPENPILDDNFTWGKGIYGGSVVKFQEKYHFWFACFHTPPTQARPQIGYAKSYTPVNIPDDAFLSALIAEGVDSDNSKSISYSEAESINKLDIPGKGIMDITGIEAFINLDTLNCSSNQIIKLDVSNSDSLKELDCSNNQLSSLNVSFNAVLEELSCSRNQLENLDVSDNDSLKRLYCSGNELSEINVSDNTVLEALICGNNRNKILNVSNNTLLLELSCGGSSFTNLDISENVMLKRLTIIYSTFTNLDISKNVMLEDLTILGARKMTSLDVSKNTKLINLWCVDNQLTELNVSNNIELKWLDCSDNQLTSLDVSNNTALTELNCEGNQLTKLNVSGAKELVYLHCNSNSLLGLDLSNNSGLGIIRCERNQLSELNVSGLKSLWELSCGGNQLITLDLSETEIIKPPYLLPGLLSIKEMPTLHEVCVWTMSFPPEEISIDTTGSPNVCFDTICDGICVPVGIVEISREGFDIFPNPTFSSIHISGLDYPVDLKIYNINGRLLKSFQPVNNTIDISELSNGVYILKIISKDKTVLRKVVKE